MGRLRDVQHRWPCPGGAPPWPGAAARCSGHSRRRRSGRVGPRIRACVLGPGQGETSEHDLLGDQESARQNGAGKRNSQITPRLGLATVGSVRSPHERRDRCVLRRACLFMRAVDPNVEPLFVSICGRLLGPARVALPPRAPGPVIVCIHSRHSRAQPRCDTHHRRRYGSFSQRPIC